MKTIGAVMLGASVLLLAAASPSYAQNSKLSNARQESPTQSLQGGTERSLPQSQPLFIIGKDVGVHLWAPVQPHYDTHANRNFAADPLWEAQSGTSEYSTW